MPGHSYQGKKVLVAGAARSGIAAAELLISLGAGVMLYDAKPAAAFPSLPASLNTDGCECCFEADLATLLPKSDLVVLSPGFPLDSQLVKMSNKLKVPVLGELAFAASCAVQEIIAVTGTNGKTTTVSLLGEIFRQAGRNTHVAGNIGYPLSAAVNIAKPDDLIICEVSSFQLETAPDFRPDLAVLLNITPDHLDRHGSFENYANLKMSIFKNMSQSDHAVLNWDDESVRQRAQNLKPQTLWFSMQQVKDQSGAFVQEGWLAFQDQEGIKKICPVEDLKIPGEHNLKNALAACAAASAFGVPSPVVAYALKHFVGVEHRIEFVKRLKGIQYLNDSKGTNPDSTIKAIQTMKEPSVIILGGYDKQVSFDALAACVIDSGVITAAVLIGKTAEKIKAALNHAGFHEVHMADSLAGAVSLAENLAVPGGTVLFSPACASFDMFDNYEQRGQEFKKIIEKMAMEQS